MKLSVTRYIKAPEVSAAGTKEADGSQKELRIVLEPILTIFVSAPESETRPQQ